MMSADQARNVAYVFRRLMAGEESRGWTDMDTQLCNLEWLDDDQLLREAEVAYCHHAGKNPRCQKEHAISECFIPNLVDAASSVLDLYRETGNLHVRNRYILACYLAIDHGKMIITD